MKHPIPDKALDDCLAFVGTRGSGKTYTALGLEERLLDRGSRVVHVDPLGVAWGLRLDPKGKKPSRYKIVIFGGPHNDLPINEHAGALLGETVAKMAESCIIDTSEFATKAAEIRFMRDFTASLYAHATKEPVHIVFDEVDMYAPQQVTDKEGGANKLLGMMETIVRRGRVKGLIPWMISQRPAVVNKNILTQVDGMIFMKLTSPQDRAAVGLWIKGQADVKEGERILGELPAKQTGEGFVWIPARGILAEVKFPVRDTFDSSRSPKRGERKRKPKKLKAMDLGRLKDKLATVEAEAKANDPRELRAEIARLKAEKAKVEKIIPKIIPADKGALKLAYNEGWSDHVKSINAYTGTLATRSRKFADSLLQLSLEIVEFQKAEKKKGIKAAPFAISLPHLQNTAPPMAKPPKLFVATPAVNGKLPGPQQRIIDAIAWWNSIAVPEPTRAQVAFVAGYKPNTGTYRAYVGSLNTAGLTQGSGGKLALTNEGLAQARQPESAPTNEALHRMALGILPGPQKKILKVLLDRYPGYISRHDLAVESGYGPDTGTFRAYLGSINSIEMTETRPGEVKAADILFPAGG